MSTLRLLALGLVLASVAGTSATAEAQYTYSYSDAYDRPASSPEYFNFEFRVGGYTPKVGGGGFETVFGDDLGPMIGLELDFFPLRIPWVGLIGGGFRFNWAKYTAPGCLDTSCTPPTDPDMAVTQEVKFRIFPLQALAVLRVDVLARELDVPLVFTGKIGFDTVIHSIDNGGVTESEGTSFGLHWGAQVALELDFINPRRAANLDDEWGINHSTLFFELFGSTASFGGSSLAWTGGLGLTF